MILNVPTFVSHVFPELARSSNIVTVHSGPCRQNGAITILHRYLIVRQDEVTKPGPLGKDVILETLLDRFEILWPI